VRVPAADKQFLKPLVSGGRNMSALTLRMGPSWPTARLNSAMSASALASSASPIGLAGTDSPGGSGFLLNMAMPFLRAARVTVPVRTDGTGNATD
jgi:hypothetical protein